MRTFLAAAMLLATIPHANAQQLQCGPVKEVMALHKEKWKETEIGAAQIDGVTIMLILASPEGKTWSLIRLSSNGLACLMGHGANIEVQQPAPGGQGI